MQKFLASRIVNESAPVASDTKLFELSYFLGSEDILKLYQENVYGWQLGPNLDKIFALMRFSMVKF